jgi:ketosteroid isomerase-like protein
MKADAATMSRLESDHVVMLMPDGSVHGKTQDIEESKNGTFKCEAMDVHDMKVDVHGNTAIVTGRTTLKNAKYGNQDVSGEYQFVDTWMSNGGQWQLVAAAAAGLKH